jgi:phage portal protein BeeE
MGLINRFPVLRDALFPAHEERDTLSFQQWANYFTYNSNAYGITGLNQTLTGNAEPIEANFGGFVSGGLKDNAVIFACMSRRAQVFSQARFRFRQIRASGPGDLIGTPELDVLNVPWPGGTTADLMARAIFDVDLAGNFYGARRNGRITRLRPDWVDILLTAEEGDPTAEAAGYVYYPNGRRSGKKPVFYDVSEVAHFAPTPDPIATFRGMSWITPLCREVEADSSMTRHKGKFFDNGGTPNLIVKLPETIGREAFNEWRKTIRESTDGLENAYKTLFLGGGADATVVGANIRQLDFKITQGAGETRIAAAAGVPAIVVGLSEGLQSATYSNFAQARRAFADTTCAHLWANMAGSMARIINVPPRTELWYDADIPFLREDAKDAAEIEQVKAATIRSLIDAGFEAQSVIDAVTSEDMTRLKHTGLFSVQLQAPGSTKMPEGEAPGEVPVGGNGSQPVKQPAGTIVVGKPPVGSTVGKPSMPMKP